MFNVFELGMTAKLDDLLQKLTKFESFGAKELNVELEISGLNLLFIIQVCSNKCSRNLSPSHETKVEERASAHQTYANTS